LQSRQNETEEEVRKVSKEIEELQQTINELKKEEAQLVSQESKCLEDLQAYKRDKTFLDLLAISCGEKPISLKTSQPPQLEQPGNRDSTFLTSITAKPQKSQAPPRKMATIESTTTQAEKER
jgi:TolA-binding protein